VFPPLLPSRKILSGDATTNREPRETIFSRHTTAPRDFPAQHINMSRLDSHSPSKLEYCF